MAHVKDLCICGNMKGVRSRMCNACFGRVYNLSPIERLWRHVERAGPDECWLWTGTAQGRNGYGGLNVAGKMVPVHKMVYETIHGQIPIGLEVCHSCDHPLCVNPNHLFVGSHRQNMQDASIKGRMARGEKSVSCKLTEEKVLLIRQRYAVGDISSRALAREYGVEHTAILNIVHRVTWKHLVD